MGLIEGLKPDLYTHCPECENGEIKEETSKSGLFLKRLYCEECGYEPEREEVLKHKSRFNKGGNSIGDDSVHICRECHEEVSPNVQRCPHCGWKPEKKGGLWWATTALMSLNPIGWAMGAKGASDGIKAGKGVTKKVDHNEGIEEDETGKGNSNTPVNRLDKLGELREKGVITEEEFENKKEELLEEI